MGTEPLSDSDRAYADRLADFIIDHINKPYTAEECGRVLEVRPDARPPMPPAPPLDRPPSGAVFW